MYVQYRRQQPMSKHTRCPRAWGSSEDHSSCLDTCSALSEPHVHFAAQDNTSSCCTWQIFQHTPELIHIIQNNVGGNSSELSCLKASINHALLSSLRANKCSLLCNAMQQLGLKLPLYTPWTAHWGIHPGLQFWKPNDLGFILFSFSVATCVLDQMELLRLVEIVILLTPPVGMQGWAQCLALTLTDLILLPRSYSNATKMNHMGSPSAWGH